MTDYSTKSFHQAIRDFHQARFKAGMEQLMARLTGKSAALLSYEDVRYKLKAESRSQRLLKDIPLDAIVGSVGRYSDFSRSFYPLQDSDQHRWAQVEMQVSTSLGLPPIEVYQIGEVYFVIDGNHRVSVARQMGASHIEAYVTEVHTKVPLTPNVNPDDIILKERYLKFLEKTQLDQLRPGADLTVTVPGQYRILEKHIELHRFLMGLEQQREVPYEEAVENWYDEVYMVVVQAIREQNILKEYPGRTETDLYLWVSGYRVFLEEELEWQFGPAAAETRVNPQANTRFQHSMSRIIGKLFDKISFGETEAGPLPGEWRREQLLYFLKGQTERPFRLFSSILVPVDGQEKGWFALNQALGVARREGGRLLGLHVVPTEATKESQEVQAIKTEFIQRCAKAGIPGQLAVEVGNVAQKISDRAGWADLVVLRLVYPPSPQPIARLSSGLRSLIRRCRSPLLIVPRSFVFPLDRALLAYDGSPKAQEALYLATYLATRWQIPLAVLAVQDGPVTEQTLSQAQNYFQQYGVTATFITRPGPVAEAIVTTAEAQDSNLIIMGGYGYNPVWEIMLGSAVDEVLRASRRPILICS